MELSKQVINFIKTFRGLIRDYKFDALYEEAYNIFISNTYFIGELTDAFLASGIDPVGYFHNEIPFNYLHGSKIKTYSMPDRIEWIGQESFIHCKDLRKIKLSKNLRYIGDGAFQNCMMLDVDLTQSPNLRTIGLHAFDSCMFTSVVIPESVTTIEASAFRECSELESVTILGKDTVIEKYAFFAVPLSCMFRCKKDSKAEQYAKSNGFKVEYI